MAAANGGKTPLSARGRDGGPPGLPQLISWQGANTAVEHGSVERAKAVPLASGNFWACNTPGISFKTKVPESVQSPGQIGSAARRVASKSEERGPRAQQNGRVGVQQIMQWVDMELDIRRLSSAGPSTERVRVFSEAFGQVIDLLPSYRPCLLQVQKEYDALLIKLQEDLNALAPLEGRLKTVKAESLNFMGESMTWFQMEIDRLKKRLKDAETERDALREEKSKLVQKAARLQESSEKDRNQATESHAQNLDILKHLDRLEKQVEQLRKQEREVHAEKKALEVKLKDMTARCATVEEQLKVEREKNMNMVSKDEVEILKAEIVQKNATNDDLDEKLSAKIKDYIRLVEEYNKETKQTSREGGEARPLTPRPSWCNCKGMLDAEFLHSIEKADATQELLVHVQDGARTLLAAYGLVAISQRSTIFQKYAKHPLTWPICEMGSEPDPVTLPSAADGEDGEGGAENGGSPTELGTNPRASLLQVSGRTKEENWLSPDTHLSTPQPLRHSGKIRNLHFSRRKTSDFIESVINVRLRHGVSHLAQPFVNFMMEHPPEEFKLGTDESMEFLINIYAAVRQYAAEPDFLAYLLLLQGKITDTIVRDNRNLCAELIHILPKLFEPPEGPSAQQSVLSKKAFFDSLRDVLENKTREQLGEIWPCLPAGDKVPVNYEWLLTDNPYVLSPVVYVLRLQHLEESEGLCDKLEQTIRPIVKDNMVKVEAVESALKQDQDLSITTEEDIAKAFCTPVQNLKKDQEMNADKFLELMKHGEIFHMFYFPQLPDDAADMGAGEGP